MMAAVSTSVWAYDFEVDGIYYNILNANEVEVTNEHDYPEWNGNSYGGNYVTIPQTITYDGVDYTVTAIGDWAFFNCYFFEVNMPGTITAIGNHAFDGCYLLSGITIPGSVASIGEEAFSNCYDLSTITVASDNPNYDSRDDCNAIIETASNTLVLGNHNTVIPASVTAIGNYAFCGREQLEYLEIPNSVIEIGVGAFQGCRNLRSIILPEGLTSLNQRVFWCCFSLEEIWIPFGVTYIGEEALADCTSLTYVEIPEWVTTIADGAFHTCNALTTVVIGPSVTTIGEGAFNYCRNLTEVIVPPFNVTLVESDAFEGTPWLENQPNGMVYIGDLVAYKYNGQMPENTCITINEGTVSISSRAFFSESNLYSLEIPASVTVIGNNAFKECSGLQKIICRAATPPEVDLSYITYCTATIPNSLSGQVKLYVPAESVESYRTHSEWGKFVHIVPFVGGGPGDVDGDGSIGINDVTHIIDQIIGSEDTPAWYDVDGDGIIGINDVTVLIDMILSSNS